MPGSWNNGSDDDTARCAVHALIHCEVQDYARRHRGHSHFLLLVVVDQKAERRMLQLMMVLDNEGMLVLDTSTDDDDHREANPVVALRDQVHGVEVWDEVRPLVAEMVIQIQDRRAQVEVGC